MLTEAYTGDGMMLALHLPPELARALAVPGGEDAADLHCTLVFLGSKKNTKPGTIGRIRAVCEDFARAWTRPLKGILGGVGRFCASPGSDGKDVFYLSVDIPLLPEFRERLVRQLEPLGVVSMTHGYTPHVTLKYMDPEETQPYTRTNPIPVRFNGFALSVGGEREYYPFNRTEADMNDPIRQVLELGEQYIHRKVQPLTENNLANWPKVRQALAQLSGLPNQWTKALNNGDVSGAYKAAQAALWAPVLISKSYINPDDMNRAQAAIQAGEFLLGTLEAQKNGDLTVMDAVTMSQSAQRAAQATAHMATEFGNAAGEQCMTRLFRTLHQFFSCPEVVEFYGDLGVDITSLVKGLKRAYNIVKRVKNYGDQKDRYRYNQAHRTEIATVIADLINWRRKDNRFEFVFKTRDKFVIDRTPPISLSYVPVDGDPVVIGHRDRGITQAPLQYPRPDVVGQDPETLARIAADWFKEFIAADAPNRVTESETVAAAAPRIPDDTQGDHVYRSTWQTDDTHNGVYLDTPHGRFRIRPSGSTKWLPTVTPPESDLRLPLAPDGQLSGKEIHFGDVGKAKRACARYVMRLQMGTLR